MINRPNFCLLLVFLFSSNTKISDATHFRGSMISWRVVDSSSTPLVVEILQRHAWKYDRFPPLCTEATIITGQPLLGDVGSVLSCVSNCPSGLTTLGSIRVPCTGYNTFEDYAMGENRFNILVPQNSSFIATFASTAWFALVTGTGLPWSVAVQVQTFLRSDTKKYNNAPVITMLPIYRLRNLVSYSIKINVADNDFDPYICLWSEGYDECGGLSNSLPGGVLDNYLCYVNFTPSTVGYYAVALRAQDYIVLPTNLSDPNYLSQIPIQFIFHVYDSPDPCNQGPVYIGDLVPDICIYMPVGATQTTRVRFKVKCLNATVITTITANPAGLITSPILQDTFDPTIFAFLANFTSNAQQIGQNLFCFSAVDSIGNQGDSACLRFTVSSETSSLQPLYMNNATHYPTGTVSKTTSIWTIMTSPYVYVRPKTESYIRFRRRSDHVDYYVLDVATATDRVYYLNDRIVVNSTVVWTPGEQFYVYFDAGVLVEAYTCFKEAMPISDPDFWLFNIPYETTTTSTTSTSTTSLTSTTTRRTTPTRRTRVTTTATTTTSTTTSTSTTSTTVFNATTSRIPSTPMSISGIVGITLAGLFVAFLILLILLHNIHIGLIFYLIQKVGLHQQLTSTHSNSVPQRIIQRKRISSDFNARFQYKLATRRHSKSMYNKYSLFHNQPSVHENLVDIEI